MEARAVFRSGRARFTALVWLRFHPSRPQLTMSLPGSRNIARALFWPGTTFLLILILLDPSS